MEALKDLGIKAFGSVVRGKSGLWGHRLKIYIYIYVADFLHHGL